MLASLCDTKFNNGLELGLYLLSLLNYDPVNTLKKKNQ